MLRLVIAEDEKTTRETISRFIDWQAHGIELIGACANGIDAYDMIIDEYPDIVLTDIRMPGLDGLGLIERVQSMDMGVEFIILSGYGEFEYAKTAMRYGVREYLLKPCNKEQIIEAIRNMETVITKRKENSRIRQEKDRMADQFSTEIKKQFTIEAVTGTDDFSSLMERYGKLLNFPQGDYHLYYVSFLEENLLPDFVERVSAMRRLYKLDFCFNVLYVKNTAMMMLCMTGESDKPGFDRALDSLRLEGGQVDPSWWEESYDTVQSMLEGLVKRLQRYSRIILVDDDHRNQEIYNYVTAFRQIDPAVEALEYISEIEEMRALLAEFFSTIEDVELARMLAMRLVVQTATRSRLLQTINGSEFLSSLYQSGSIAEIRALAEERLLYLSGERERHKSSYKDFVNRAMEYVREHLADPQLSMKWLAENHLYMNVDYFSRQFIKETGEKFSAYLNRARMEKARELILQYDSDRIYKVAEQVGCGHNPQYFSQLFKKWSGFTPSQYREQNK